MTADIIVIADNLIKRLGIVNPEIDVKQFELDGLSGELNAGDYWLILANWQVRLQNTTGTPFDIGFGAQLEIGMGDYSNMVKSTFIDSVTPISGNDYFQCSYKSVIGIYKGATVKYGITPKITNSYVSSTIQGIIIKSKSQ